MWSIVVSHNKQVSLLSSEELLSPERLSDEHSSLDIAIAACVFKYGLLPLHRIHRQRPRLPSKSTARSSRAMISAALLLKRPAVSGGVQKRMR